MQTRRYILLLKNVSKLTAMVRACTTGWACNVFNVLTIFYMHGSKSYNFASQF